MTASGHIHTTFFPCIVSIKFLSDLWNLYRVIQEERSVFWEVVVSVIVRESLYGHVQFWLAAEMELLECTNIKALWVLIKKEKILTVQLIGILI